MLGQSAEIGRSKPRRRPSRRPERQRSAPNRRRAILEDRGLQNLSPVEPAGGGCGIEVLILLLQRQHAAAIAVARARRPSEGQRDKAATGQLEHDALPVSSAPSCCAEQIACSVGEQAASGPGAVETVEADQGGGGADVATLALREFEHRARVTRPAVRGRTEQIVAGVDGQAGAWKPAIAGVKADERDRSGGVAILGLSDLENRAAPVGTYLISPAPDCRAEQISMAVKDRAGSGVLAIGVVEADQDGGGVGVALRGLGNFEYGAAPVIAIRIRAAEICRAEQIAFVVGDQAPKRIRTVGAVEAEQDCWSASVTAPGLDDLEHRAQTVRPAGVGCSEKVTLCVDD